MQTVGPASFRALALLTLMGNCISSSDAFGLRQRGARMEVSTISDTGCEDEVKPDYEVVEKKSLDRKETVDCICNITTFWHFRINQCVKQGPWAYECGFFPAEHWNKVCADTLKCEPLEGTEVKYGGFPGATPASCKRCEAQDQCLVGKARHEKNCLKEFQVTGEACQTVRVTIPQTATAKVTETVTASSEATAKKTVTAEATATATEAGSKASATKKATAEGEATAKAEGTGKATEKAKATKDGVAEGKACIKVAEVKEIMKLKDVPRMPAVLSAKVVAKGDEIAFDRAYEKALAEAVKNGMVSAKDAASAKASAKARESAGQEAKAAADEAAAWAAEAGASKEAQAAATKKAYAKAQTAAADEAKAAAKAAADAQAKADAAAASGDAAGAEAAAEAAAAAKAAAEAAEAKNKALSDYLNKEQPETVARPTTTEPPNKPVKITDAEVAATKP